MFEICLWIVAGILLILAGLDSALQRTGRHCGKFAYRTPSWWPRYKTGFHRGRYVEDPAWKAPKLKYEEDGRLVWEGTVTFANVVPQNEIATLVLTPPSNLCALPSLIGPVGEPPSQEILTDVCQQVVAAQEGQRRQEIRQIVDEELNATPIFSGLTFERSGRFGDSDIDQADTASVCAAVETGDRAD